MFYFVPTQYLIKYGKLFFIVYFNQASILCVQTNIHIVTKLISFLKGHPGWVFIKVNTTWKYQFSNFKQCLMCVFHNLDHKESHPTIYQDTHLKVDLQIHQKKSSWKKVKITLTFLSAKKIILLTNLCLSMLRIISLPALRRETWNWRFWHTAHRCLLKPAQNDNLLSFV